MVSVLQPNETVAIMYANFKLICITLTFLIDITNKKGDESALFDSSPFPMKWDIILYLISF